MQSQKMLVKLKKASSESQKGNYLKSISLCKQILEKETKNVVSLKLLATSLIKLNRFSEVEVVLKKVIELVSEEESYSLLHLLGCNYINLGEYLVALKILEELFNRTGDSKILLDIALSYFKLGNYEAARDIYFKLIELEPNNHQAKFNLYPILLHFQDYKNAWVCFHSRLQRKEIIDQIHWFAPMWNGEPLIGKTILIYPEQGIGDNLAYTGCFSEAIADAKHTYIACDNRLKGLYKYNFPSATILSYEDINIAQTINADINVQILAGSLTYLYRETQESFVNQKLLAISPDLTAKVNQKLSKEKLKIGISWFHGRINDGNEFSMYLEELLPILKIEGIEWVNLQFGEWQKEVENFEEKHNISITHIEQCSASGDFNQYGALISNLDLVISASNAALMMASRLGKESWEYLPGKDKGLNKSSNSWLWHHSVKRFYKEEATSWAKVIDRMYNGILSKIN